MPFPESSHSSDCLYFLLLCDKLPQSSQLQARHTYLTVVNVSKHVDTARLSAQRLSRLKSGCWPGLGCIVEPLGRNLLPSSFELADLNSVVVGLRLPFLCWLSAGGCSVFLEMALHSFWAGPFLSEPAMGHCVLLML